MEQQQGARDAIDQFFDGMRRLGVVRSHEGRWFAGVSVGVARRIGVDPLIVRAAFILGACLAGVAIAIYLLAWALLPDDEGDIMAERALREGHPASVALCVLFGFVIIGGLRALWSWGSWGAGLGTLVLLGLVVWAIASGHLQIGGGGDLRHRPQDRAWESMREAWRASWPPEGRSAAPDDAPSPGNRAAQAGAAHRTASGRVDLAKHDTSTPTPGTRPVTRRGRRRGFGPFALLVLGAAAVAGAGTALLAGHLGAPEDELQLGLAGAAAVLGLALVIGGILGRRGGFVRFTAIPVTAAMLLSLAVPTGLPWTGETGTRGWTPASATTRQDFTLAAGDGTLDLARIDPASVPAGASMDARVTMGNLRIVVPADLTVRIVAQVDAGQLQLPPATLRSLGESSSPGGLAIRRTVTIGSGPVDLTVHARVGVGDLKIQEK